MSRWFRVYDDLVDDPKVQRLAADTFRGLINLWCLASKNGGILPPHDEIAFKLRLSGQKATKLLDDLVTAGLLDHDETGVHPHNWSGRQHKQDVSKERVKRFRERQRNALQDATVTAPETENRNRGSEPNGSGAEAPVLVSPKDRVWAKANDLSVRANKPEASVRTFLGKCLSEFDADVVERAVLAAIAEGTGDPCGLITRILKPAQPKAKGNGFAVANAFEDFDPEAMKAERRRREQQAAGGIQ